MHKDKFTAWLLASRDFLRRYAYSLTKNATVADDLIQDTMLNKLSAPFKMHANGYKYSENASELFLPLTTVKNRIHTAKKTETAVR